MPSKKNVRRVKVGETVSWQRQCCNTYSGDALAFCPKGTAINEAIDLSGYKSRELNRIDTERSLINRYLIWVQNTGVVSVAATTIEK
jgi:hypothetical protein